MGASRAGSEAHERKKFLMLRWDEPALISHLPRRRFHTRGRFLSGPVGPKQSRTLQILIQVPMNAFKNCTTQVRHRLKEMDDNPNAHVH